MGPKSTDTKLSVTVYACDSRVAETGTGCLELVDLLVLSNLRSPGLGRDPISIVKVHSDERNT